MYHWKGVTFEDIEENDWGGYWNGVCNQCIREYKIPNRCIKNSTDYLPTFFTWGGFFVSKEAIKC